MLETHYKAVDVDEKGHVKSSWNVAPEWTKLLQKLEGYGVDADMVEENYEFVRGFLAGAEAMRSSSSSSRSSSSAASDDSHDNYGHEAGESHPASPLDYVQI